MSDGLSLQQSPSSETLASAETEGQLVGAGKSLNGRKNIRAKKS